MNALRHNWSEHEISTIYHSPLLELIYKAAGVHRQFHNPNEIQVSSLLSIKTGGCPEDCGYCPQASRYHTDVKAHKLLHTEDVLQAAQKAKEGGASRFCLGAAWREVRDNKDFDRVLDMVRGISAMKMEVCCTLGMVSEEQAQKLADAGLHAYNHNLDTSPDYYNKIIHTRTIDDRMNTLKNVRKANLTVCCGGIIGMGESIRDRIILLKTLSEMEPHPESVPINSLVPVEGTPLQDQEPLSDIEFVRMIATTRIVLPASAVRLSAGRLQMSREAQALCFLAGANSIFSGEKLLTTGNPEFKSDQEMLKLFGLKVKAADTAKMQSNSIKVPA